MPTTLKNCQISLNKHTGKPQVVIKSYSKIEEAFDSNFQVENPTTLGSPCLPINQLDTLHMYDRVTINATVLQVKEPVTVSTGK